MLYIVTLVVFTIWMIIIIRKKALSWHSIVAAYTIGVVVIDPLEVILNLFLELYRYPTHLGKNAMADNQIGLFFSDTLILPFTLIIVTYYALNYNRWKTLLIFLFLFIIEEWTFLKLGYLKYNNWRLLYSAIVYAIGFSFVCTNLAKRIAYSPPIPRQVRIIAFTYVVHMWIGATLAFPVFNLYQFKPGLFKNPMQDDCFVDLLSGLVFGVISALIIPITPKHLRHLALIGIACIGMGFGLFAFYKGWLIYHHWNHFFMLLRYFVPSSLVMFYYNWESNYEKHLA